jgi:carbonic anhydrase/acetyltransferase-like protein (isoleucine patch superfamily)
LVSNVVASYYGRSIYRIIANRDIGNIPAGSLGGWVASENNLSVDGDCWIADDAIVFENARVAGNALIADEAVVQGAAIVTGDATVCGSASVRGESVVCDNAYVGEDAIVTGNACVYFNGVVRGESVITDFASVTEVVVKDVRMSGHDINKCKERLSMLQESDSDEFWADEHETFVEQAAQDIKESAHNSAMVPCPNYGGNGGVCPLSASWRCAATKCLIAQK